MLDEHATIPPLNEKSLAEIHKQRMASKPDPWTCAWLKNQFDEIMKMYRGLCHALSLAVANMKDYSDRVEKLEKRLEAVEYENKLLMGRTGEMQIDNTITMSELAVCLAELEKAQKRIDDMAEWARKQKGANGTLTEPMTSKGANGTLDKKNSA